MDPIVQYLADRFADRSDTGIGDTVARLLQQAGLDVKIRRLIDKVTGGGCACDARKAALNKRFPYRWEGR